MRPATMKTNPRDSPNEPQCYTCMSAIKRGNFRLCSDGEEGYKHIGVWKPCKKYKPIEEE